MSMSKTFIGGAVCREFESEAIIRTGQANENGVTMNWFMVLICSLYHLVQEH